MIRRVLIHDRAPTGQKRGSILMLGSTGLKSVMCFVSDQVAVSRHRCSLRWSAASLP